MSRATTGSRSVRYRRWWPPAVVGALGLVLSVLLFQYIGERERQLMASDFELHAQEMTQTIERRVGNTFETVHALAGHLVSSERTSWQGFQIFSEHLLRQQHGVESVQWLPRVRHEVRDAHEAQPLPESLHLVRQLDNDAGEMSSRRAAPDIERYEIRDADASGAMRRAEARELYTPIHYISPWDEGQVLWGLDLSDFAPARRAMGEAMRTGVLVATPPIHQELVWVFGYVRREPAPYDGAEPLDGFVAGAFRVGAIVEGVERRYFWPHRVVVQIWDDSGPGAPVLIYGPARPEVDASLAHAETIELGRRQWRIVNRPSAAYMQAARTWTPTTVLITGVIGTGLLVVLLGAIISRSERIGEESRQRAVRERQQAAVARLGVAALSGVPGQEIMQRVCEAATHELGVEYAKVLELDEQGGTLLLRAGVGWKPGYAGRARVVADRGSQAGYTLEADEPVVVEDFVEEARFAAPPLLREHDVRSGISVTIQAEDWTFGVLGVHATRPRSFYLTDVAFVQALANVLGQTMARNRAEAELRESERRFRRLSDATPAMIWMSGVDKQCTYLNRQWLAFTGRTLEQDLGAGWMDSLHDDDREAVRQRYVAGFELREPFRMEYRLRRADGVYRWIVDQAMPRFLPDGSFSGYVGACIDVTSEKEAAQKLRTLNETLERRVSERTSRLREANEQLRREVVDRQHAEQQLQHTAEALKRSNRELEQFAYIASHDLQEPLRKVQGFGRMLEERAGDRLDEASRDFLNRMFTAVDRMRNLIDGLLAYSRVTTKASPFERVDMSRVADEVLSDLDFRIAQTSGQVQVGDLPTLTADPLQMRQLLQNLIGNALKFHRPDEAPQVEVWAEALQRDASGTGDGQAVPGCRLFVRDNGIGIAPEHRDRLFTPFRRLHGRSSPYEGAGIGLAVCAKIARRHGGRIDIQSQPDHGATFVVTLPCEPGDSQGDGDDE